jgi:hypothetical protein
MIDTGKMFHADVSRETFTGVFCYNDCAGKSKELKQNELDR